MKDKSLKIQKTESYLKELVPEAFATLEDSRINSLLVTDVDCSKGKYDATVYLSPEFITEDEQKEILKQLRKANHSVKEYCLNATGWFRCPSFQFKFDKDLEKRNRIDKLFEQISKGKKDES